MIWVQRVRNRLRDESGVTLVELMAAMTILSVGFFALASTGSVGLRLVAQGRQRQAATEIANARLEHLRNIPYADVALPSSLTPATDDTDPDYWVSSDGLGWDYEKDGTYEDLVIASGGAVTHIEDPVVVGGTELRAHQYVTWVDDPSLSGARDYKRLTVVVTYKRPISPARPRSVRVSALFTAGSITIGGAASGAQAGTTSTPSPSAAPTPSGSCDGDTAAPGGTFSILSGTGAASGFTASAATTVSLAPSDGCTPITARLSNDGVTFGDPIVYDAVNPTVTWTLTSADGAKTVYARFEDGAGNQSGILSQAITLDTTKPSVPGTLTRSVSCSGATRNVTLSWGASSDVHFLGYRVYRSIDNGAWSVLTTSGVQNASDAHSRTRDSVRYRIVAYDKAGNESNATNVVALSKNQCS